MLTITREDVVAQPFPHVIKDGILPADFYKALRADFPSVDVFEEQRGAHGRLGSRTGAGFDIYRGEPAFDALTRRSEAWREFAGWINSEAFADKFRDVFADHLDTIGLRVDVRDSHVNSDYAEPRELLTETATLGDKVAAVANVVTGPFKAKKPVELFTRLDIHKSTSGYAKKPHCDRPNRLCSLIIYFCDAEERGLKGGDLQIFAHNDKKPVENYERHPHPENVAQVAQLRPRENLGVFFPCQNNSYHGVTQVESSGVERDFLYINVSGRTRWLW
ncbi:MAG: 2OG-Fe(II) oxygenase [Caulobacterales bacterium]|nr:2OG-Fe(II) oxygenase [Caulobacterales bacterium]